MNSFQEGQFQGGEQEGSKLAPGFRVGIPSPLTNRAALRGETENVVAERAPGSLIWPIRALARLPHYWPFRTNSRHRGRQPGARGVRSRNWLPKKNGLHN
jgi:hypothetical protein